MALYSVRYNVKDAANGRRFKVGGESLVSGAAALAYAQSKLKVVSGEIISGSASNGLDITQAANQPGHTDASDGLNLNIKSATGLQRNIHIPNASSSYASTLDDGSADIEAQDLKDVVTAYNTATGLTFVLVSARYTSEG